MYIPKKQLGALALGLAIGALAGGLVGLPSLSSAQEDTTTTTGDAKQPGDWMADALRPLVEAGTITQAQADSVIEALVAAAPHRRGPGGHHRFKILGLDAAADAIGITTEELATALQQGSSLAEVATSKGVEPQAVIDALIDELKTRLDEAVSNGRITQAQADEFASKAATHIPEIVNGTAPLGRPGGFRPGRGGPGPGGLGPFGEPGRIGPLGEPGDSPPGLHGLPGLEKAAEAIGMTTEELATALRDGSSIAEVATSKGVEPQAVLDALIAELKTRLDEAVGSGRITRAQAEEITSNAVTHITEMVNAKLAQFHHGPRGWEGFRPFGPLPGSPDSADPVLSTT